VKQLCRLADISSKSLLLQVVRQQDPQKMVALVEQISAQGGMTREQLRETVKPPRTPKRGRPKSFVFSYRAPSKAYSFSLSFKKPEVPKEEVIQTLEAILAELKASADSPAGD